MKGTHLTLDDRIFIQRELEAEKSKSQIAKDLGKSPSTISKEVKLHRKLRPRRNYARGDGYYCANRGQYDRCHGCKVACEHFEDRICKRREKIGVCNKCPKISHCYLDKYFYQAATAHKEYLYTLSDSREGVNLTTSEMIMMAETIGPLLKRGQSVYQIIENHPELNVCVKTLYNKSEGPYIQTFIFENAPVMIGFLHEDKTSASMADTLDLMQEKLGEDYYKLFSLIVTDRGSEFEKSNLFEFNHETGEFRTNIFYCDPQQPAQKPHVENNHNYVRDIIPNGKN